MSASAFIFVLLLQGPIHHGSTIPTGAAANDWSASFIAWWDFEESAGSTALANDSTSCGSAGTDCDLSDNATVGRDTTNYQEGSQSSTFVRANSEYFDCADSTCDELDGPAAGTVGCWHRTGSNADYFVFDNYDSQGGGRGGYYMRYVSAADRMSCRIRSTNSIFTIDSSDDSVEPDDNWDHLVCRWQDDVADSLQIFINGSLDGTLIDTPEITADGEDFFLGSENGSGQYADGELDECFVIDDYLTDAEICRVCSCQIDGSLCTCNGASYDDSGRNSSDCGSCTLPDCNAAAP